MFRSGDWAAARAALGRGARGLDAALRKAVAQEAEGLRKEIVQGLTRQAPGGKALAAPAEATLTTRRLKRFHGTKALVVRADLRNAVCTVTRGDEAFVGVKRTARGRDGRSLADVARVQEFGSGPRAVAMTAPMSRFLAVLRREMGLPDPPGPGRGYVVLRTPPRPFVRPAAEAALKGVGERFAGRVGRMMGWRMA